MARYVRDIMTRNVITIPPDSVLKDAYTIFRKNRISMLVVEQAGKVAGLLTERDAVRFIHDGLDMEQTRIADVMSSPVTMVDESLSLFEAYSILSAKHFRHLVIADKAGLLAGVITLTDMLDGMGIEYFVDLKQVESIMSKSLTRVRPDDSLRLVIDLMHSHKISCIVVAEQWKPAGIITERDIVKYYDQEIDLEAIQARTVMTSPVYTLPESTYIPEANIVMHEERIRHMVIVDQQGRLSGLISQTDLTSCMEAGYISYLKGALELREKELSQISREHDLFLRKNPNAVIAFDAAGHITNANPAALRLTGFDLDTLTRKHLQDLVHSHDLNNVLNIFHQLCEGEPVHAEFCMSSSSDKMIDVYNTFLPILAEDKVYRIYAVIHDITDKKKSEQQLYQSERKFRVLAELSQAIPWSLNFTNGCFNHIGKQIELQLGYPVDSWLNMATWAARMHPEDREKALAHCAHATEHREDHQFSCRMIAADGRVVPFQHHVSVHTQTGQTIELNGFMFSPIKTGSTNASG